MKYENLEDLCKNSKKFRVNYFFSFKEEEYLNQINKSNIWRDLDINIFQNACLLCSESSPKKCHRRLLAEFIVNKYKEESFQILHL